MIMSHAAPLEGNLLLLREGLDLLARLSDDAYAGHAPGRSAAGAQYRHILDHYDCLLGGLDSGFVDYDARQRDPEVERDRAAAADRTEEVMDRLRQLGRAQLALPLRVTLASLASGEGRTEPHASTLGRELLFVLSHTVHHFAIMRLLLEDRGVACDPGFGVAPSTLAHQQAVG